MSREEFEDIYQNRLTPKQKEVIPYLLQGLRDREIAQELGVRMYNTITHRISSIRQKFEATDRRDLIFLFYEFKPELVSEEARNYAGIISRSPNYEISYPESSEVLNSPFYIQREGIDYRCQNLIDKQGCLIRIKGPRQMGKTSLINRLDDYAEKQNNYRVYYDFSADVDTLNNIDGFFYNLGDYIADEVSDLTNKDFNLANWNTSNSVTTECTKILKQILSEINQPLVLFFDNTDRIFQYESVYRSFAPLLRYWHEKGRTSKIWNKLKLVLAHSTEEYVTLNINQSPFTNVGETINLIDLTLEQITELAVKCGIKNEAVVSSLMSLIPGFTPQISQPETVLKKIIKWTGGQPFLTQKLCSLVTKHLANKNPDVDEIVRKYTIDDWESHDYPQHFRTICDRLLHNSQDTIELLDLYRQILQQKTIVADTSLIQNKLRISGLVNKKENYLRVYNPIYELIFNEDWIQEQFNKIRPYSSKLNQWQKSHHAPAYLLDERELLTAIKWAENRNISREDHIYIATSREFTTQKKLQQELSLAREEKKRIVTQIKKFLFGTIAIAGAIVTGTTFFAYNRNYRAGILQSDIDSNAALQRFNNGEQIEGQIEAIAISSRLRSKIKNKQSVLDYLTIKPLVNLNQINNQIQEKNVEKISDSAITQLFFSSNGRLIIGDGSGLVKVWQTNSSRVNEGNTSKNRGKVIGIAVNSNQQSDSIITVYDRDGNLMSSFETDYRVSSLAVSSERNLIITGNDVGELAFWTKEGQKIFTKEAHKGTIESIAISPDNNLIATTSYDLTAKIWTFDGTLVATLSGNGIGHQDLVNSIAFSPDGKTIATASIDNTIKLWDVEGVIDGNLNETNTLLGHNGAVNSVAFSPDGKIIASASSDKTIRLWKSNGVDNALQTIQGHHSEVNNIVFSPDSKTFASADDRGTVKIWQMDSWETPIDRGILSDEREELVLNNFREIEIKNYAGQTLQKFPKPQNKLVNSIDLAYRDGKRIVIIGTEDGYIARSNDGQSDPW